MPRRRVAALSTNMSYRFAKTFAQYSSLAILLAAQIVGVLVFSGTARAYAPDEFVTTWKTDNNAPANEITLKTGTSGGLYSYNYTVDWGDGDVTSGHTGDASHAYATAGTYTVKVTGEFPRPSDGCYTTGQGDLISVEQWGSNPWKTMEYAFMFCGSIAINAIDAPNLSQATSLAGMFREVSMNNDISHWDVSTITNMNGLFAYNPTFNQPLDSWNVSNVTDMNAMFLDATTFNQPLNSWNVSNVTDMNYMFGVASSFNQPLSNWNTGKVIDMQNMFSWGPFNQDISGWDTSSVTNMTGMFALNTAFNQPLNSWNVSNVTDMGGMFGRSIAFNQPLNNWNTSSVIDMSGMFMGAQGFDQSLGSWDVRNVTDMTSMFGTYISTAGISAYNYDATLLGWSTLDLQNGLTFTAGTSKYCSSAAERSSIILTQGWTISDGGVNCSGSPTAPFVTTDSATVDDVSVSLQGEVTSTGGSALTAAGFQYSTDTSFSQNSGSVTTSVGTFSHDLTLLTCDTTYYYRAYATNAIGTAYGTNKSFVTGGCPFITTWKTDNPGASNSDQITISTAGGGYNYSVDWGDGIVTTGHTGSVTHTYATAGTYTVEISGNFPRITMGGDEQKLLTVEQWGDITWSSMEFAFDGATNLQVLAADAPNLSGVTSLDSMFRGATTLNADISHWNVSTITDMYGMFSGATSFNQSLNGWNVSNVTSMQRMFSGATSFNSDISQWNTAQVQDMRYMFSSATTFNQPLNSWNVSAVTNMQSMFARATSFNQPLNSWNVSAVTNMSYMFELAQSFNGSLLGWVTSSLTNTQYMFSEASSFNQPINHFDMSNVSTTKAMFYFATSFNQPLNNWDVGSVTNMDDMFMWADAFNQPVEDWNTASMESAQRMFYGATSFNQSLGGWDMSSFLQGTIILLGSGQSPANYDATIIGWAPQPLQNNAIYSAGATYCTAEVQRASIISTHNWSISDGGKNCPSSEEPEDPVVPDGPVTNDEPSVDDVLEDLVDIEDPDLEQPDITEVTQVTPSTPATTSSFAAPSITQAAPGTLFALAKRIPEPIAIGFPWLLLLLALVLVGIQYYQVHSEALATKRMETAVANQERLVEEQNNFVALSTHYLHTPLTVMEGEITLMVKAGTLTQAEASKLKATLTSLNAEAEAVLAQEEQHELNN